MTTGDKITKKRKEYNLTQEELAYKLGVSRQSVSSWENGLTFPETEKLIALSDLFGVSVDYLLREQEEQEERLWKTKHGVRITFSDLKKFSYTSERQIFGMPLVSIAKNAKGFLAIGLMARGVFSIGLLSFGLFAIGVLPIGLFVLGSIALGLLSCGGFAFGLIAFGGLAFGVLSFGGLSVGIGAIGGAAFGQFAYGGYANATYLAIGDVAIGQIALGSTSATGELYSYVGVSFSSVAEEVRTLLESVIPHSLDWLKNIFLAFLR